MRFASYFSTSSVHLAAQYFKRCKTSVFIALHENFISSRKLANIYGVWTVMMNEVFMNSQSFLRCFISHWLVVVISAWRFDRRIASLPLYATWGTAQMEALWFTRGQVLCSVKHRLKREGVRRGGWFPFLSKYLSASELILMITAPCSLWKDY